MYCTFKIQSTLEHNDISTSACMVVISHQERAILLAVAESNRKKKKPRVKNSGLIDSGGADGARTRDPRRDRPVF
ncbi:hypothetical protein XBJ2_1610017 [Xenorhabdus bovienii str. Jollieti]|nr:hypothetical protein XBJ2_1610017 [Xenorhabdus bovienii str. Jollieti]